ncbi:hypothetical protein HNQ91_004171 [Filimonas zeae]|uniref:DUF4412 domain-containing protein n=1 Tax=Filimonas zeae TaxID=1737353 RepID=A0A917MZU2_9BACT|nr:hypothetical protein [Filimonas zeae]MDR6341098.1 hypothetical protein [Filimonas zeae]GGH77236.1 hypothetical protein GCM10011379_43280 [Filimonas zeae]
MKYLAVCFLAMVSGFGMACKSNKTAYKNVIKRDSLLLYELPVNADSLTTFYRGDFKGAPISVALEYIAGKRVCGYNIHKGLRRNMSGSIMLEDGRLHLVMREPGTNMYDGVFDMWLDTTTHQLEGKWKPLNGKEIKAASFSLARQEGGSEVAYYVDTTGTALLLREDGACEYTYMVNDSTEAAQQLMVKGSYKYSPDRKTVTCYWETNDVFPSRTSVFTITVKHDEENDYDITLLTGEGKVMTFDYGEGYD